MQAWSQNNQQETQVLAPLMSIPPVTEQNGKLWQLQLITPAVQSSVNHWLTDGCVQVITQCHLQGGQD